ncbi:tetratricopeptide repeat protein [Winogradskyella sp.]|uniref:tetratricopeptide repeat protein n=1 Tax=Winogradskyella sp. TaxID=1883156 RepID=UPI0025F2B792|nr:tetratricopeptide repeat protein [Winogradskyella sp.]MCT4629528.1 tetratricopeptide repeat protein [Winogradskyella sp.]
MKKVYFTTVFLICFLLLPISMLAQNSKIDSLNIELQNHKQKDTVRVIILNQLAYQHYRNNPPKAVEYVEQAAKLADEIRFIKGKARSFYLKGAIYMEQANFNVAIENLEKAKQTYKSINDIKGIAKCNNVFGILYYYKGDNNLALEYYNEALSLEEKFGKKDNDALLLNIGNIYSHTGEYQKALENFEKALVIHQKNNDSHGILNCLNSIGSIYYRQGNYPLSLKYYNESLEVAKKANDSIGIFQSFINTGNLYRMQNLNNKALNFYNKALAINAAHHNKKNITGLKNNIAGIYYDDYKFDIAITFFKESIAISREIGDDINLATGLNGLGFTYFEMKKYDKALRYFKEANTITLEINQPFDLLDSYHGMADTYYGIKNYDLALINAKKLAQLSDEYEFLRHKKNAHLLLSRIYKKTNNYKKALESYEQFKILSDSIFNEENIEKITQLEYEYKYKQQIDSLNINELKLTKKVLTTSQDLEKSQRNLFLGVIGFLATAIILGSIIFFLKLRNEKTKTQNIAIEQKLLRSQMTPHFIFNSLSVLQGMILNKEDKKSVFYLSKFSKLLRITLENSRDKLVPLNQELEAVNNYLELQNLEDNTSYDYTILVDKAIDEPLFKIPPMLIQPFVENAIEHAFKNQKENRKIDIQLNYLKNDLICTITDNGIGIDVPNGNQRKDKKSLATTITSERLKMLSKDFNIKGSVVIEDRNKYNEQGTIVTLVIPYKKEVV